jgi:type II secretory pathway component PulF
MNHDEFAFFNQQLAAMLREGLPLEGALRQLAADMRTGPLRAELERLEADLSRGTPLNQALAARNLPPLFVRMVEVGTRGNDLPGVLTLLADHYHRANAVWTRLKGLMVYPLIVIFVGLGLTVFLSFLFSRFLSGLFEQFPQPPSLLLLTMWFPPFLFAVAAVLGICAMSIPSWRARLRWRLPAFREAGLAQVASALSLMLQKGTPLPDALAMAEVLESGSPAAPALARWRAAIQAGRGKPAQWSPDTKPFPPLFLWLVQRSGENVSAGFQKAAEIYQARAAYRVELLLYGALPVSMLLLGLMIFWQVVPMLRTFILFMNMLGASGE